MFLPLPKPRSLTPHCWDIRSVVNCFIIRCVSENISTSFSTFFWSVRIWVISSAMTWYVVVSLLFCSGKIEPKIWTNVPQWLTQICFLMLILISWDQIQTMYQTSAGHAGRHNKYYQYKKKIWPSFFHIFWNNLCTS